MKTRNFKAFVGIDLGGGKGKKTALAVLKAGEKGARVVYVGIRTPDNRPFHDDTLVRFIKESDSNPLVAIDAPLFPTVCLRCGRSTCPGLASCLDPVAKWFKETGNALVAHAGNRRKPATTPYTQRACEVILHRKHGILPRETLGQGMGPLTARAHYLRRLLEPDFKINQNLIEVFPKATIHQLFGADKARQYKREVNTWKTRAEILEALQKELVFEIWREGCLQNDHCFDAVICAYTGYLWTIHGWQMPKEDRGVFEQDGWIWFPPRAEDD